MRDIPEDMAARIESGAATLCHAWVLRRTDGAVAGFTDHDRDLIVGDILCRAASGWEAGASDGEISGGAGTMSVGGVLGDGGMAEADILSGAYDGARCEAWRVDWMRSDLRVRLWRGTVSSLRREGDEFIAEIEGPLAALERVVGRTYGRTCDAVFGDGRCTVQREDFPGLDCNKRWETCTGIFGNSVNFRGFPNIPGDDFLTAYPAEGGRHDGGSRR